MHITQSRNINPPVYILGNIPLNTTKSCQYLGLTIDAYLSWATHTDSIVARANCLLGFIRTVAQGSSPIVIFTLYKSLVWFGMVYLHGIPIPQLSNKNLSGPNEQFPETVGYHSSTLPIFLRQLKAVCLNPV